MGHILVVDDEPNIVAVVRERLEREGFQVRAVASGEEALAYIETDPADLVVLDVMLPGIDGFEVLRRLRSTGNTLPVIILTARDEDVDKIVGLELGADDYLAKPFNPRELSARIRAILRRQAELKALEARMASGVTRVDEGPVLPTLARDGAPGPQAPWPTSRPARTGGPGGGEEQVGQAQGLRFDHSRRQVWFRGHSLVLRPKEYALLHFLARHPGLVFTREALLSHVWGHERYIDERTVDVHVRRLRSKLAAIAPDAQVILTEWGVGYRLAEDI